MTRFGCEVIVDINYQQGKEEVGLTMKFPASWMFGNVYVLLFFSTKICIQNTELTGGSREFHSARATSPDSPHRPRSPYLSADAQPDIIPARQQQAPGRAPSWACGAVAQRMWTSFCAHFPHKREDTWHPRPQRTLYFS